MYVHSRAGLAGCNLGGETYIQPIFESQIPDNPFGKQQLVGGSFYWIWQELYFILLIYLSVQSKIANLAVAIFYLTSGLRDMVHTFTAEIIQFCERFAFMITFLICSREQGILLADYIILKFSHSLELHPGGFLEGFFGPHQSCMGSTVERLAVLIVETAKETQGRYFIERVHECRTITRNHIQIAVTRFDEGREKAGSIHTFPFG